MVSLERRYKTKRLVVMALFCAIAYLAVFVFRISGIGGFLTFDVKDTIITLAAMVFGPLVGVIISFVVALFEMVLISGTGPWGALMNFASSAVFAGCASAVYRYFPVIKKRVSGAVIGLGSSVVIMTAVMMILNLFITPIYLNVPVDMVKSLMFPLLMPFNAIKAMLNASLVMMLYKTVSSSMKRMGIVESAASSNNRTERVRSRSIIIGVAAAVIAIGCVVVLLVVFEGDFSLIRTFEK